ncbi:MAG: NTP transferase domain-containing protein [Actinomycetota bacterium]|nr:NTP transferase domain-containing protein [Actinomycetota bacterium]
MSGVVGAVLAAGSGARMGRPKAELELGGQRLVDRAVDVVARSGCSQVLAIVREGLHVAGARTIVNPAPERGMRSSLRLAVDAAGGGGLAVVLVDTPGLSVQSLRSVLTAWVPGRIAVASYGAHRGHPIVMSVELWYRALAMAGPDEGARAFLALRPELVDAVAVTGDPTDLDTPGDLARWTATHPPGSPAP